jgi:hypothetical protein
MKRTLLREILIYAAILLVLALLMHPDLLSDPAERMRLFGERGNFLHPLVYAGILYVLAGAARLIIRFVRRIGRKRKTSEN